MNVGSVYNSEGGYQLGTFDARYSITYFNGIGYNNNNAQDYFYLQNSQFETVNGCEFVCEKEYRFQTCRVNMTFDSSVGFVGRSVPFNPATNPIPALLQFVHYCDVVILGSLSLQYNDASVNGFAYLNSDQFSKVQLKPTSLLKTNGGNPNSAFYVNIMSDLVVNTTVINSNLDGSNPAGSKLRIREFYFGAYPDIDNTWIDYEIADATIVPTLVMPPFPSTVTTAGGQFSRVTSVT
jgi:hypothetical protein